MTEAIWLDAESTARRVDLRVDQVMRYVRAGKLPAPNYRFGPKSPRWNAAELDAWMKEGQSRPRRNVVMPSGLANAILAQHRARRQKAAR